MIAQGEALGNGCGPSSALKGRTNHPSNAVGQYALTGLVWVDAAFPRASPWAFTVRPCRASDKRGADRGIVCSVLQTCKIFFSVKMFMLRYLSSSSAVDSSWQNGQGKESRTTTTRTTTRTMKTPFAGHCRLPPADCRLWLRPKAAMWGCTWLQRGLTSLKCYRGRKAWRVPGSPTLVAYLLCILCPLWSLCVGSSFFPPASNLAIESASD